MADLNVTVVCPACHRRTDELMPLDRCVFFWECSACHAISKPKAGDCCVYCSYGDRRCPPVQDDRPCASN